MAENHTPEAALTQEETNEQRQIRIDKLRAMQEEGRDPFQVMTAEQTHESAEIKENFDELENKDVFICGRIIARRIMGKASFVTIQDKLGRIQSYVSINDVGENTYKAFKKQWDIGDIIEIRVLFSRQGPKRSLFTQRRCAFFQSLFFRFRKSSTD